MESLAPTTLKRAAALLRSRTGIVSCGASRAGPLSGKIGTHTILCESANELKKCNAKTPRPPRRAIIGSSTYWRVGDWLVRLGRDRLIALVRSCQERKLKK